jgi:DNA modification methylase
VVLDPFAGSGTVGDVAAELGRDAILVELNPVYVQMQKGRDAIKDVLDEPKSTDEPQNKPGWLF